MRIVISRGWCLGSPVVPAAPIAGGACGCGSEKERDVLPTAVPVCAPFGVSFLAFPDGVWERAYPGAIGGPTRSCRQEPQLADGCGASQAASAVIQGKR